MKIAIGCDPNAQQAKEELRQDRLQKKESEKLLKIQQKQEVRLEKQGKRLQK